MNVQRTLWIVLAHDEGIGPFTARVHYSQKSYNLTCKTEHTNWFISHAHFIYLYQGSNLLPTIFDFAMWFELVLSHFHNRNFSESRKRMEVSWRSFHHKVVVARLR